MKTPCTAASQRGLGLVEVLVGLAIGLLGVMAALQTATIWMGKKQTTSSGSDAQAAGTLASFHLERDLKQAGQGFGTAPSTHMGCTVQVVDNAPARTFSIAMAPVRIIDGESGAPDEIQVLYGSSSFSVTDRAFTSSANTSKTLKPRAGMRRGDLVIVAGNDTGTAGSAQCQLVEITDDSNIDGLTIMHADASYTPADGSSARPARFNGNGAPPVFSTGMVYNLGPAPRLNVWKITGHRVLSRTDQLMAPGTAMEAGEDVIDLQAQYGIDANNNLRIEDSEWTNAQPTDWQRVLAVRFAVLVRSQQYEKTAVTTTAPTWGSGTAFVMTNVDGTPDSFDAASPSPNNWRRYRYRVYQNTVPLRNMLWGVTP